MANKTIENLDTLDINNYNPDEDLLIVQKPNGATYHMSATNIMNPVAGGMVFLSASGTINTNQGGFQSYNVTNLGIPSSASNVFISIQHRGAAHPNMNFSFYTANHNGVDDTSIKHNFIFNASDKSQWTHNSLWAPVIDENIYYHISSNNSWYVYIHAYM